jgi:hypothetical protein
MFLEARRFSCVVLLHLRFIVAMLVDLCIYR